MSAWWDESADIVIAGAGLAGLKAAISAASAGAKVVLLEKTAALGGKSAISIGSFTASETDLQRAAGVDDSHAQHLEDMTRLAESVGITLDRERAQMRIAEDQKTLAELVGLGIVFSGPHPEAPHSRARMHNVVPGPKTLIEVLSAEAQRVGVSLWLDSPLADVILDATGAVAGAIAGPGGHLCRIMTRAVVLAAGDYVSNPALLRQLSPRSAFADPILPQYAGEQHQIALRIGARLSRSEQLARPAMRAADWPHVQPSPSLFEKGAVLVDRSGELRTQKPTKDAAGVITKDEFFIIVDRRCAAMLATAADDRGPGRDGWRNAGKGHIGTAPSVAYAYLDDCRQWPWYFHAETIDIAAAAIGCRMATLADALQGAVAPFDVLGPFKFFLTTTRETIATDATLRVLSVRAKAIPGLYAAGDTTKWLEYAGGHGYGLSWAATSGRLAAEAAMRYVREHKRQHSTGRP